MENKFQTLKTRLAEVDDLNAAAALLHWDQSTYMPPGGSPARGRQLATLSRLAHEKFVDPEIGRLLEDLQTYENELPYDSDKASLLRVTRREHARALQVPPEFTARLYSHAAETYDVWTKARPDNNFAAVASHIEKMVDLSREWAEFFSGYEHIADPLISVSDYGMKTATVRALFSELQDRLVPIVDAITSQEPADDSCLKQHFPEAAQLAFGEKIIRKIGYDFERGRQDKTHHPFMIKFSLGDVRITTRVKDDDLSEGLFSTIHEAGHALYEQGIQMDLEGTPLADGTSSGIHESQSRLWENLVGRSLGFWQHYYPQLQAVFPDQLEDTSLETFYRAINKVQRSLIRTDADEVTYNLHVIIRFGLEVDLLEGNLAVRDLPEVWHTRYKENLGVQAPDDRDGILQDVHWYSGPVGGAFQGYTLGNIMSAHLYEAALAAEPQIPTEIQQGEFDTLRTWMRDNVYQHGSKFTADEIIMRATGEPLSIDPYLRYLTTKYGALYSLPAL